MTRGALAVAGLVALSVPVQVVAPSTAMAAAKFQSFATETFENGWREKLFYASDIAQRFREELDTTDDSRGGFTLNGARGFFESDCDQCTDGLEAAHLTFVATHGGAWTGQAVWSMWNEGVRARSIEMWLGNESVGAAIFATMSCETHKDDGQLYTRWRPVFQGGLKAALGSHDKFFFTLAHINKGRDFADALQNGDTLAWAWKHGMDTSTNTHDISSLFMGNTESDCTNRRETMKWQNFGGFPKRTDDQVNWWCAYQWTDA